TPAERGDYSSIGRWVNGELRLPTTIYRDLLRYSGSGAPAEPSLVPLARACQQGVRVGRELAASCRGFVFGLFADDHLDGMKVADRLAMAMKLFDDGPGEASSLPEQDDAVGGSHVVGQHHPFFELIDRNFDGAEVLGVAPHPFQGVGIGIGQLGELGPNLGNASLGGDALPLEAISMESDAKHGSPGVDYLLGLGREGGHQA